MTKNEFKKTEEGVIANNPFPQVFLGEIIVGFNNIAKDLLSKVMSQVETHPELVGKLVSELIKLIPEEILQEDVEQIAKAVADDRPIIIVGPHWSQMDVLGFLIIKQKVDRVLESWNVEKRMSIVGPASSKFYSVDELGGGLRLMEGRFIKPLGKIGLTLIQIIQAQDTNLREVKGKKDVSEANNQAWKKILESIDEGHALGIFPSGTRGIGPGADRPKRGMCTVIRRQLTSLKKGNPLLVGSGLIGSHRSWGLEKRQVLPLPTFKMSIPISVSQAEIIRDVLVNQVDSKSDLEPEAVKKVNKLDILEIPIILSLYYTPEEYWGDYEKYIKYLRNLVGQGDLRALISQIFSPLNSQNETANYNHLSN